MKPGFGNKAGKKKAGKKSKKKANKAQRGGDGDDVMVDAAEHQQLPQQPAADGGMHTDDEPQKPAAQGGGSAKERQRSRMQLKQALRVKVASLKGSRQKLTKLPANKEQRRKLNTQIKQLMAEQADIGSKS